MRAPIPQKQETLISAGYEGYPMNNRQNYRKARIRTVFDGFRNFGNEASGKFDLLQIQEHFENLISISGVITILPFL